MTSFHRKHVAACEIGAPLVPNDQADQAFK